MYPKIILAGDDYKKDSHRKPCTDVSKIRQINPHSSDRLKITKNVFTYILAEFCFEFSQKLTHILQEKVGPLNIQIEDIFQP